MIRKFRFFIITAISVSLMSAAACSGGLSKSESKTAYKEPLVIDVFVSTSNYQGIQSGWFGKIVKDKFNMELNIIAPNVSTGGSTLLEMRSASGNLGDLIICSAENGELQSLVDEDLIIDMRDYIEDKPIMQYQTAISLLNDKMSQSGIFAIPTEISTLPATTSSEGPELTFGPYLRWDIYSSIGYPQMSTLEDLLPVLKDMQTAMPNTPSGNPTYAFSFFNDWDDNMMNAAKQPACFYGYDEIGFVLAKADGSDYQNILDPDSLYMRILKFYFDANQMGLVDPDSYVQSYEDVFEKYRDGSILYCPWPWAAQSAFNTIEHKENGQGYMLAPIDDLLIFSNGCNPQGNQKTVIAIGSDAKDPERLADFIDWIYSPEGIQIVAAAPSNGAAGPKGLTWDMSEDGPYLTEFGIQALLGGGAKMPDEWGGLTWEDGFSQLNLRPVSQSDLDPDGYPYYYNQWDSVLDMEDSLLDVDWKSYMGADSSHQYLEQHNQIIVAPGSSYVAPAMSSELTTIRNLCKEVIVDYSWQMVFAKDEATFYDLMNQLQKKTKALGYSAVYEEDLKNAKDQDEARKAAVSLGSTSN